MSSSTEGSSGHRFRDQSHDPRLQSNRSRNHEQRRHHGRDDGSGGNHHHSIIPRSLNQQQQQQRRQQERNRHMHQVSSDDPKDERYVVPALPMPLAVICCILNFLIPGFGTIVAGISVLCCARTDDMTSQEKCGSCLTVIGIGFLQLLLTVCFLIGWIWSCIWGVTFIGMSSNHFDEDEDTQTTETPWERSRRARGRSPLPTPEIVVNQPYPGINYSDLPQRTRTRRGRPLSRISLTASNLIYPLREPSNLRYSTPPPSYSSLGYHTVPPSYASAISERQTRSEITGTQQRSSEIVAGQERNNSHSNMNSGRRSSSASRADSQSELRPTIQPVYRSNVVNDTISEET
ncbi:hypothetical protein CHS0354_026173 [Potamilus streckersoni]|uniref:Protein SPEC3 n=1 Tax=Potamilus streckersoni TaxID=2493646 RepID=A0AAE0VS32_9BIVA|nr:hypothetical protein CHS0354_026173 [Potamilus streckersoni]